MSQTNKANLKNENLEFLLIFCSSILMLCLIFIEGENFWLGLRNFFLGFFGINSLFLPIFLLTILFLRLKNKSINKGKCILTAAIALFFAASLMIFVPDAKKNLVWCLIYENGIKGPGILGGSLGAFLLWSLGVAGARAFVVLVLFLVLVIVFGIEFSEIFQKVNILFLSLKNSFSEIGFKKIIKAKSYGNSLEEDQNLEVVNTKSLAKLKQSFENDANFEEFENSKEKDQSDEEFSDDDDNVKQVTEEFMKKLRAEEENKVQENIAPETQLHINEEQSYRFPPIDLLSEPINPKQDDITNELNTNGKMLIDTLASFNVKTKIVDINRGPAVTRYEIQPASGVKVSKITTLADDIALNLAALGVRIEAPIPGKSAVGVEIPNRIVSIVSVREIIESDEFIRAKSSLTVVLGRDISGKPVVTDLGKMPHLLIAGSTGAGKSVCVNSFIVSILFKAAPEDVKLLMIDPKVVELGVYNGIPHLLVPVVTDPRKSAGALNWAVNEMLSRYKIFAEIGVRDIASYNNFVKKNQDQEENSLKKMARIVIIVDELSDLMMAAPNEIEDYICRLTQMARAAGMHLVIATQRPSVDVITGIIKANVPSRIALAVSSQVDSRTILDMGGAEKLLGRGDMLFSPLGAIKPMRVQGCFVTDEEIEQIVSYVKGDDKFEYDPQILDGIQRGAEQGIDTSEDAESDENEDPKIQEAIKCVIEAGQASTSLLQRKLRLGYARAGRLIDEMEKMGIVGPHEGSKARQVMITYKEYLEKTLRD